MPGRLSMTVLACACATVLAGCGGGDEGTIPQQNSEALLSLLGGLEGSVAAGDCDLAEQQAEQFAVQVEALPAEVEDAVRKGLSDAAVQLTELVSNPNQCETQTGDSGESGFEPSDDVEQQVLEPPVSTAEETEPQQTEEPTSPSSGDGGGGESSPPPTEQPADSGDGDFGGGSDSGGIEPGDRKRP